MNDVKFQRAILSHLRNVRCHGAFFNEGTLILNFNQTDVNTSVVDFILRIYCKWRLRNSDHIIMACYDRKEVVNQHLKAVEGVVLDHLEDASDSHDLRLVFSNGLTLETFSDSVIYGQWCLKSPNGTEYTIGPGLKLQVTDNAEPCDNSPPHSPT